MNRKITDIVLDAIKAVGEMEDKPELLHPDENLRLFGGAGVMDSLSIVMLISEVEDQLLEVLDVSITLADDRAMSQKTSPFRSVKTLVHYISKLLNE
jgi:acyl carrier protein